MKKSVIGLLLFVLIILIAFTVGSYILSATFFGTVTLIGLIAIIESVPAIKWLAARSTAVIDITLFVFTIMATMQYGLNIAASLTVAGAGYSLFYAPWLKEQRAANKKEKQYMATKGKAVSFSDWKGNK